MLCAKCGKELKDFNQTAYGEARCDLCFDDHLMTDKGKVEYLICITMGDANIEDYDADFLGHVAACWNKYRDELNLTLRFIYEVEEKAKALGIL